MVAHGRSCAVHSLGRSNPWFGSCTHSRRGDARRERWTNRARTPILPRERGPAMPADAAKSAGPKQRLAPKSRENLRKRKAQARARRDGAEADAPTADAPAGLAPPEPLG